ncbi:MAG: system potassium uptake protein, partial [Miltoncostaeaceae bacterium]|nr:system potassium uptake protein [Miltoncostaeaceae bacterium]
MALDTPSGAGRDQPEGKRTAVGQDAPAGGARPSRRARVAHASLATLTIGALGVVFGDIGTSPLYALHTVLAAGDGAIPLTNAAVYGVISMVFWSITLVVSVKYVILVMRADNDGEGGILALIALIQRLGGPRGLAPRAGLVGLGIFGASLFFGDA